MGCFIFTMIVRKFVIEDEITFCQLEVYINNNDRIILNVGDLEEDIYYQGFITLDIKDTEALILELQSLINTLKNG